MGVLPWGVVALVPEDIITRTENEGPIGLLFTWNELTECLGGLPS